MKDSQDWRTSEITAWQAMQTGLALCDMTIKQQDVAITGILFKTAVITGCPVPSDDRHLKVLEIEMAKFINENKAFAGLTFEEILTAFRFNAAGQFDEKIKHWNNIFNLEYLGEVLNKWITFKQKVKIKAERELLRINLIEPPMIPALSDDEEIRYSLDAWNTTRDYLVIRSRIYGILRKSGEIKLTDEARQHITNRVKHTEMDIIWRKDCQLHAFLGVEELTIILSKKIAVSEYFDSLQPKNEPGNC